MYNADLPTRAELPTTRQLIRSTLIALGVAIVIMVTAVLPGEYGVDPTGVGRVLGLTQMGEIKMQLAEEAAQDMASETTPPQASQLLETAEAGRTDEMTITLSPGEGAEVKLAMNAGALAEFEWTVEGGVVNYDLHGDGGGNSRSYQQGRGVPGHRGALQAAFDGNHGWFWRNRGVGDVTITLRTRGAYADIRRAV
jgi:hypothetical protein